MRRRRKAETECERCGSFGMCAFYGRIGKNRAYQEGQWWCERCTSCPVCDEPTKVHVYCNDLGILTGCFQECDSCGYRYSSVECCPDVLEVIGFCSMRRMRLVDDRLGSAMRQQFEDRDKAVAEARRVRADLDMLADNHGRATGMGIENIYRIVVEFLQSRSDSYPLMLQGAKIDLDMLTKEGMRNSTFIFRISF